MADDVVVTGTQAARDVGETAEDVRVEADRSSVACTAATDITVAVLGDRNSVTVEGADVAVTLRVDGERNSATVGEAVSLTVRDEGRGNSVQREQFVKDTGPDLVRTAKDEAYADLGWFGTSIATYQTEATEREYCHNCGRDADAIVYRHEERVLSVFGVTITLGERATSDECEHCTEQIPADAIELTEAERRDIYG